MSLDRTKFIGGSDAAAIMGLSPWATPVDCWREKTGKFVREFDKSKQRILDRGKRLEPVIIDMVIDKLAEQGHEVELLATNARYYDKELPYFSCEIDFELMLDGEHINGDAKSVIGFARKKWGDEETEEVPIEYAAQFMHGLGITGRGRCLVAALIGLDDVMIYWVNRDDETIQAMRDKCSSFWVNNVLADVAPEAIRYADILTLYPRDNGQAVEASAEIMETVNRLKQVSAQRLALEKVEDDLKFAVTEFISPHAQLNFNGKPVCTWKAQETKRLDGKRLAADMPDLHKQYLTSTSSRVLRHSKERT